MNRAVLLLTLAVAAALLAFMILRPAQATRTEVDVRGLPRLGLENAPVTVVVVEDFKCPVCKLFEEEVAPALKTRYVDTGKAKVYSLIFPFLGKKFNLNPDDSVLAAQAAKCMLDLGGNDGFQAFKTRLFRAQGDEATVWLTRERLTELAQSVEGIDQAQFQTCLTTNATLEQVTADEKQALSARVNGIPSVFVNGQAVDWRSMNELKDNLFQAIDTAAP